MIRTGRYDAIDKWGIVCRSWGGEEIDVGLDRLSRPCMPNWRAEAFSAGRGQCVQFLNSALKEADVEHREIFAAAARDIDPGVLRERAIRLIDSIPRAGFEQAAADLPPEIVKRLKEVFKFGALKDLRYTEDVGEVPDIEVLRAKQRPFPRHVAGNRRNVLGMFCAMQYGILDAIHIYDAAPDAVTLVDFDREALGVMQQIYPPEWTYFCGDYKEFLRGAQTQGLIYDLVTADPWAGMCEEVAFDMLPTIAGICSDVLVLHYLRRMFEALGTGPDDFDGLSRAIHRRTGVEVTVIDWVQRSKDNGYLVMQKR